MEKRLLSINGLSLATGRDRATITKRLADIPPDETRGKARLYDLDEVINIIMGDDSPRNKLRELVNGCVCFHIETPLDAVADTLRDVLTGQPPELVSKAIAKASLAQVDAWRRSMAGDKHFQFALDVDFCRDVDGLARRLLKTSIAPNGKTQPRWRQFDVSKAVYEEIEKHTAVPAHICSLAD